MAPYGFIGVDRKVGRLQFQIQVSLSNRAGMKVRGGRLIKVCPMAGVCPDPIKARWAEILGRGDAVAPVGVGAARPADGVDGDQTCELS